MGDPPVPIPARRPTDTFRGKRKPDSKRLIENIQRRSKVDNSIRMKPGDAAPKSAQQAAQQAEQEDPPQDGIDAKQPPPIARKPTLLSGNPTPANTDEKKQPPQLPARSTATQLSVQIPTDVDLAAASSAPADDEGLLSPTGPPPDGPPPPAGPPSDAPPPPLLPEKTPNVDADILPEMDTTQSTADADDLPRCPSRSKKPVALPPKKKATPPPPPTRNGSVTTATIPGMHTAPVPDAESAGTDDTPTGTAEATEATHDSAPDGNGAADAAGADEAVPPPRCPSRSRKPVPVPPRVGEPATTDALAPVTEATDAPEAVEAATNAEALPTEADHHSLGAYIEAETVTPADGIDPYEGTYDDPTTSTVDAAPEETQTHAAVAGTGGESSTDTQPVEVAEEDEEEDEDVSDSGYGQQGGPTIYAPPKKSFKKPSKPFVPDDDAPESITNKPAYDDMRSVVSMIEDDYEKPEDGEGYDRFNEIEPDASSKPPTGGAKPRVPSPGPGADKAEDGNVASMPEIRRELKRKPPPPVPVEETGDNADYTGKSLGDSAALIDGDDLYEEVDANFRQKLQAGNAKTETKDEDKPPAVVPFLGTVKPDAIYEAIEELGTADDDDAAIQAAMAAHAPPEASHPGTAATPDEPPPVQLPYNVAKADAGAASPSPADTADDEGDDAVGALSPKSMRKKKGKGAGIDKQKRASSSWFSTKKKRLVAMPQEYDDILCQVGDADTALMTVTAASTVKARITGDLEYDRGDVIEIVRMDDCPAGKWVGRLANGSRGFLSCADVTVDPAQVRSLMEKAMIQKRTTPTVSAEGMAVNTHDTATPLGITMTQKPGGVAATLASEAARARQGPNGGMMSVKRKPRPHDAAPPPPSHDTEFGLYHGPGENVDEGSTAGPTPALPARGAALLPPAAVHDVTEVYAEVEELPPASISTAPSYETMEMVNNPKAPVVPGYEDVQQCAVPPAQPAYERMDSINAPAPAYERMDSINAPQPAYERMDSINAPQPAYEQMDNANNPATGAVSQQPSYEEMGTVNAPNPNAPNPPPAFQPEAHVNSDDSDDLKRAHPYEEMLPPSSNEAVATAARQRSAQVDGKMVRPRPKSAESKEEIRAPPTPPTPAARPSNAIASQAADPVVPEIEEDGIYDNAKLRKGAEDGTAPPELLLRNEVPDVSINPEYSFVTEDAEMEDVYGTMSHYGDAKPGPENAGA